MKKVYLNNVMIFLLFFCTSCATTIDFHGSTNIFTGPEVVGKTLGFNGQVGFGNSAKFELGSLEQKSIFSSQIIANTDTGIIKDNNFNSHLGLGLTEHFELYFRLLGDSPSPFGLKWQIIGDGTAKKASGFKFLIFGGVAPKYIDEGIFSAANGSGATRSYNTNLKVSMNEFGASLGFRSGPAFLIYTTPFYRQYGADVFLTSNSYPSIAIDKKALVRGVALGVILNFNPTFLVNLEAGYSHSQYSSSFERDDYALGGSYGINLF
jgi:hypothetical protein